MHLFEWLSLAFYKFKQHYLSMHFLIQKRLKHQLNVSAIQIKQLQHYYIVLICFLVNVPVGGYCLQHKQCQGSSGECKHGRCVCKAGHILYELECHKGMLDFFPNKKTEHGIKLSKIMIIFFSVLLAVLKACSNYKSFNSSLIVKRVILNRYQCYRNKKKQLLHKNSVYRKTFFNHNLTKQLKS